MLLLCLLLFESFRIAPFLSNMVGWEGRPSSVEVVAQGYETLGYWLYCSPLVFIVVSSSNHNRTDVERAFISFPCRTADLGRLCPRHDDTTIRYPSSRNLI
ncbi:hypothetical protein BO70DRAFT_154884 [Aspergillus heteromorphus CBS 117.55]|uniref:Secreted protein n=1 Tax=Aspergillus heteromorphus CBS 117.55 TaxID=1448321 RepID=A0A317V146_9EURO|nr:uncharacterized protein BO70DRAFT_154884 [Aspergillus heteromorphus CBS 117.55]PWY68054.1 hypothetical protein BO70DRAFT_154884 [Aspergillus heteromorphus CBS 117.55]